MKLIKYSTGLLLICTALIFVGEFYVWHLESFQSSYPNMTFYIQSDTTESEMMNDLYESAKREGITVFVVNREFSSLYQEIITIYATDSDVENDFFSVSDIRAGNFDSIFLGNVELRYRKWMEIPDIRKIETYYAIGEDENILAFKQSLVNQYGGKFPQKGYNSMEGSLIISAIWLCVVLLLLLFTLYEVALLKKTMIIKLIMGEHISLFVLKQILLDVAVFSSMFIGLLYILNKFTNTDYLKGNSYSFWGTFLLLNSLAYLWLLFSDYKKDIQTKKSALKVLKASYIYKIITSVLIIIVMSSCFELIFDGINSYQQKDFFEERADYSYITLKWSNTSINRNMEDYMKLF